MPNLKIVLAATAISGFAFSAMAQETEWSSETAATPVDAFTASDADTSGTLDRSEFEVFVSLKADAGDVTYTAIRDGGDYDLHFTQKDINADGLLDISELPDDAAQDESSDMPGEG